MHKNLITLCRNTLFFATFGKRGLEYKAAYEYKWKCLATAMRALHVFFYCSSK